MVRIAWRSRFIVVLGAALALTLTSCSEGRGSGVQTPSGSGGGGEPSDAGGAAIPMGGSSCGASVWPVSGDYALDVDGTERTFIVHVPDDYDSNTAYKLVLAWHGFAGTAEQVAAADDSDNHGRFFGLEPRAQGSAIFVAGQGLDATLLGQTAPGWDDDGRDVAFVHALLEWLSESYCIDDAHIFSAGVSMGGYFSNQVGCEMSDRFRAVASIIGGGPLEYGVQCTEPMAAWITHGNMDRINPYSQGEGSRDHWSSTNRCSSTTAAVAPADCVAYEGCDEGFPVHWCPFEGGHVIPDFASEGIWSFFSQF